jgi:hypothetical protein
VWRIIVPKQTNPKVAWSLGIPAESGIPKDNVLKKTDDSRNLMLRKEKEI